MADEETVTEVLLQDNFYHDSFGKVIGIIISLLTALLAIIGLSLYLYLSKPPPVYFSVDKEWRVQPAVLLNEPYITKPILFQWVTNAVMDFFVLDFVNYNDQLNSYKPFFTSEGWKVFLNQLNIYANYNNVQSNKQFVNGIPMGAPSLINEGLLAGRYGWWLQMPVKLNYVNYNKLNTQTLTLQLLVVRVSTLNNLDGVAIDNVIVVNSSGT